MSFFTDALLIGGVSIIIGGILVFFKPQIQNMMIKFRNWKEEQEVKAVIRREKEKERLDRLLIVEKDKAELRQKQMKLNKVKNSHRPKPTVSRNPAMSNPFGISSKPEKPIDYFGSMGSNKKEKKEEYFKGW